MVLPSSIREMTREVLVKARKSFDTIPLVRGEEVKGLTKNSTWQYPLWQAQVLEEEGLVEICRVEMSEIGKKLMAERRGKAIQRVEEWFFNNARITLKREEDPEKERKMRFKLKELLELRLEKITRMALTGEEEGSKNLTEDEKILFNKIKVELDEFRERIFSDI